MSWFGLSDIWDYVVHRRHRYQWYGTGLPYQGIKPKSVENVYRMYDLYAPLQKCINEIRLGFSACSLWVYSGEDINQRESDTKQKLFKELIITGELEKMVKQALLTGVVFLLKEKPGSIYRQRPKVIDIRCTSNYKYDEQGDIIGFTYHKKKIAKNDFIIIQLESNEKCCFVSERLKALQDQLLTYGFIQETAREIFGYGGAKKLISLDGGDFESYQSAQTEEEKHQITEELNNDFGNRRHQRRYQVTGVKATAVDLTANITDLQLKNSSDFVRDEVANLFCIPTVLFGSGSAAYAKIAEARLDFFESFIKPFGEQLINSYLYHTENYSGWVSVEASDLSYYQLANSRRAAAVQQFGQGLSNLVNAEIVTANEANKTFIANL